VSATTRQQLRRRRLGRWALVGYTMVEIMMALGLLAVGATGILAMQKTALVGNVRARRVVTANMVAQTWLERLRQDALTWNNIPIGAWTTGDLADAVWLDQAAFDQANSTMTKWFVPNTVATGGTTLAGSGVADINGADLYAAYDPTDPDTFPVYCTHVRVTRLYNDELLRIEVRTFWRRNNAPMWDFDADTAICDMNGTDTIPLPLAGGATADAGTLAATIDYGFVNMVTAVKRNDLPPTL
jgi:Tfp pilus assembly protein PilV